MTQKRKASLGLSSLSQHDDAAIMQMESTIVAADTHGAFNAESSTDRANSQKSLNAKKKKKQILPLYIEPALHDALHTLVFSERHKKTTFQTLFMEGLDLALKERGLPSVAELSSGEKTLNL